MAQVDEIIRITEQDGTITDLPLRPGSTLARGSNSGLSQVNTVGESEKRRDTRTPQVILSDQTGGMGDPAYQEINGVTSFTDSELDTRYPGQLVLPPAATLLGTMSYSPGAPVYVEHIGQTDAQILTWQRDTASGSKFPNRYDPSPSGFTALGFQNTTGFARYQGSYVFTVATAANSIKYSADGVTWTNTAYANALYGCCVHDGKFYAWDPAAGGLVWTTNVASAAGWSSSAVLRAEGTAVQLVEWQRGGRAVVYLLTTTGLYWYDEDADLLHLLDDFRDVAAPGVVPYAHAWRRDGNLYVTLHNGSDVSGSDTVLWYSGTTNQAGPNQRGGMLTASQVSLTHAVGGRRWLFFGGAPQAGTSNVGRILAMNDQQAFHTLNLGTSSSAYVAGMGYAQGKLWTVLSDGKVYEQVVPDVGATPLYATGRAYKTGTTYYHEFAFTDGGTENMPLTALWVTLAAKDMTATYKKQGMPSGCSGVVEYLRDTDTAWTQMMTFNSTHSYPRTSGFRPGVQNAADFFGLTFNEIKLRVGITSNNSARSPVITSVALAYLRDEIPRDQWSCVVDLSDREHPLIKGKSIAEYMAVLERIRKPGVLVTLQIAGRLYGDGVSPQDISTATRVTSCRTEWSGEHHPVHGPLTFGLRFTDYTPPDLPGYLQAAS